MIGISYPKAITPTNIINGFKITGTYPFNMNIFSEDEFLSSFIIDQPLTPTSSNTITVKPNIMTPEDIQEFPKVSLSKTGKCKGRKKGSSKIFTSIPTKRQIEEEIQDHQLNKKQKSRKTHFISRKKSKNTKNESPESSESESSYGVHDETNEDPQNLSIDENDFVIVRFLGKKKISHSVGKIEKKISSSECESNFLRKRGLNSSQFIYPENVDISVVDSNDIVKKLPKPAVLGGTLQTATILTFIFDFSSFENVI
ncbi:hypothetical protein AVEN_235531-1 [Araneus ventricosus]|uniref:Uncharacterized protein n=1 Tax=Araneus ventricosus TaxID=182803 RepID=A0A4Y2A5J4_ARAVE|nr:hypothetical protein AVEN_235531-1 [Araneus ventricosus]